MASDPQKDVVAFLSSSSSHNGAPVRRIDTHLSRVFLAGDRVYKIKRALRYDFADFSTLERRKAACEKEVEINRRTAPQMYLGVIPLYRKGGEISWEAGGDVAEWAVEMVRFDSGRQFDELLARGELTASDFEKLAEKVAWFHLDADKKLQRGSGGAMARVIEQLSASLRASAIAADCEKEIERWSALARAELEKRRKQIDARGRHGWVRHCHGDLHLANICLFNGEPTPFDAIEFNDDFANIDVLYDLAFVLMDLIHHRRGDFANLLLNAYLGVARDYSGLSLLPLFLSMRAAVRAMVLALPVQSEKAHGMAGPYLDLALEFLIAESEPRLIAVGGYSGVGKSVLARGLANELDHRYGAVVLRSDVVRKRLEGRSPETRLDEAAYSEARTAQVYQRLFKDAGRALRAGQTVILDATFLTPAHCDAAAATAQKTRAAFAGLWLTAPRDVLVERVSARSGDASDATVEVLLKQLGSGQSPEDWRIVNAGESMKTTLRNALEALDQE